MVQKIRTYWKRLIQECISPRAPMSLKMFLFNSNAKLDVKENAFHYR